MHEQVRYTCGNWIVRGHTQTRPCQWRTGVFSTRSLGVIAVVRSERQARCRDGFADTSRHIYKEIAFIWLPKVLVNECVTSSSPVIVLDTC
jgi:hypothetical protein